MEHADKFMEFLDKLNTQDLNTLNAVKSGFTAIHEATDESKDNQFT